MFVPADQLEPLGTEFPLQLTFQRGSPVVSGRVQVVEHCTTGRVRGYFVKYVELNPGGLALPLNPRRPRPQRTHARPSASILRVLAEPVTEPRSLPRAPAAQ